MEAGPFVPGGGERWGVVFLDSPSGSEPAAGRFHASRRAVQTCTRSLSVRSGSSCVKAVPRSARARPDRLIPTRTEPLLSQLIRTEPRPRLRSHLRGWPGTRALRTPHVPAGSGGVLRVPPHPHLPRRGADVSVTGGPCPPGGVRWVRSRSEEGGGDPGE